MEGQSGAVKFDSRGGNDRGYYSPVHEADNTAVSYQHELPVGSPRHEMYAGSPGR